MSASAAAPKVRRRPAPRRVLAPWKDRQGRFSWMKALVLAAAFVPGLVTLYWALTGGLGGRPVMEAIHQTGLWAIRFLMIALAVTPARAVFDRPRLILLRRMLLLAWVASHPEAPTAQAMGDAFTEGALVLADRFLTLL